MKKHIIAIILLSITALVLIHLNLTRAILFEGYLESDQIIAGQGLYLEEMIESAKGNWRLGSPYLKEWKDRPYLYVPLNIYVAGFAKRAMDIDAKIASIVLLYGALFVVIPLAFLSFLILFRWHWLGYISALVYLFSPGIRPLADFISPPVNFIFSALMTTTKSPQSM